RHDRDMRAKRESFVDAVGDEDDGAGVLLPDADQLILHVHAVLLVERAERLVHQAHLGGHQHAAGGLEAAIHTGSHGIRLACWNTMPRSAPGAVIVRPSTVTWPVLGLSKPAIMFWSVDFPQPEGPSRQRNSFLSTDSVMSSSATTSVLRFGSRKILLTFDIWIVAISPLPALNRGV